MAAIFLTYKYRLLPTKRQHKALEEILESQRQFYNAALEERIDCYRKTGRSRTYVDQCASLTICRREIPDMSAFSTRIQRWTLRHLDRAYKAFFRRLRSHKGKAGFPRFRGERHWKSFGFSEFTGIQFNGKRLRFDGIPGSLRVHLHRPLPSRDIRSCVFRRDCNGWYICFQIAVLPQDKCAGAAAIGIDLGLKVFVYQSDGVVIPNPQFARKAEHEIRRRARALSRCKRGSRRREKVRARLARTHQGIVNQRTTWLHQQSARITNSYNLVVAEDLNVSSLIKNPHLSRSIADASWSKFLSMIAYKAEKAGKHFITVNPRNTSQKCSGCDELVPKSLAVRTHSCPQCGLIIDRDHNASLNILRAAVLGREERNVTGCGKRALGNLDLVSRDSTHSSHHGPSRNG